MVTQCHGAAERNKVRAFDDFLIFGCMTLGSFSSGQLLADFGWGAVNAVSFPAIIVAGALVIWLNMSKRTISI